MRISARADGAHRLGAALHERASGREIDAMLREMAMTLRAEAARELADVSGMSRHEVEAVLSVTPLPEGSGYAVTAASGAAWEHEFGSLGRPPHPWLSRAVGMALPLINHIRRRLLRRLGAASRFHRGW